MPVFFGLRFDLRNPAIAETALADRYEAALDMAEWADQHGCVTIGLSEHHASPDQYIPSPLVMVAAMVARTRTVRFSVAALLAPFYEPIRLAEDMVVLDHLSRGRVDLVVAGGYVPEEFGMFGVPPNERGRRVTEVVRVLRGAFSGEPFEFRGRTVHITPGPYRPGGPSIMLGGTTEPAARRAARIADGFVPSDPKAWEFYRDEMQELGRPDPGPQQIGLGTTVALAEDKEKGWEEMAPFFLHETNAYGAWAQPGIPSPYRVMKDVDELRASGLYDVVTPDEFIADLKSRPVPFAFFHPLCGGTPPALAWSSLRLFEHEVMPAFADT